MIAELDFAAYLEDLRRDVCSCCPERQPGGPPCAPLGKACGVEMHLRELVDCIRGVTSDQLDPYREALHGGVCARCSQRGCDGCPCPMDSLSVRVVRVVEDTGERLEQVEWLHRGLSRPVDVQQGVNAKMRQMYEVQTGDMIGCN